MAAAQPTPVPLASRSIKSFLRASDLTVPGLKLFFLKKGTVTSDAYGVYRVRSEAISIIIN